MTLTEFLDDAAARAVAVVEREELAVEGGGDPRLEAGLAKMRQQRDRIRRLRALLRPLAEAADALGLDADACERLADKLIRARDPLAVAMKERIEAALNGV